ncbi:hypothetical protein ACFXHA_33085 [Nocardia sp. NPDC059240]|uniref:hypothetical protein n=1 Tax=Nocardia sp. NPDC059240 TaxID=3346786 RepID=UPI003690D538
MDGRPDVEIRALRDVIDAVEARLRSYEANGGVVTASRSEVYATVIYAVIASAGASGHYGSGSLARAPLLEDILDGEGEPWETAIYSAVVERALTR